MAGLLALLPDILPMITAGLNLFTKKGSGIDVNTYDEDGEHHAGGKIPIRQEHLEEIFRHIHHPRGDTTAYVQIGRKAPRKIKYHSHEIQQVKQRLAGSGSPLAPLLNMIPIVGPLISGFLGGGLPKQSHHQQRPSAWSDFLREHMASVKRQHPTASHGEVMRTLGQMYRARQ